jgi:hypothetical protein
VVLDGSDAAQPASPRKRHLHDTFASDRRPLDHGQTRTPSSVCRGEPAVSNPRRGRRPLDLVDRKSWRPEG